MTLPIVERLRQKELSGSKVVSGERVTNRRNFDGDEAADTIEELVEALRLARAAIVPQPAVVPLLGHIDTILTKIGGDQ